MVMIEICAKLTPTKGRQGLEGESKSNESTIATQ